MSAKVLAIGGALVAIIVFAAVLSHGGSPQVVGLTSKGRAMEGNFVSYAHGQYGAYTGMWGLSVPGNERLQATSSMRVDPTGFPASTRFAWDVVPDPNWLGVNGFLHVSYGNYDDSPGRITSRRISDISELAVDVDWSTIGSADAGLLCETWLTPTASPSGEVAKTSEVAFFPKVSPAGRAWLATLPPVGEQSFTDSRGLQWEVRQSDRYFIAYRPGYADFRGALPFRDYFAFLAANQRITVDLWFNGLAFGVEPREGAGTFTVRRFAPTYAGA